MTMGTAASAPHKKERQQAESTGDGWRVYPHREKGKPDRYMLVVTVAVGVLRKARLPAELGSQEERARFAAGAAPEIRRQYLQEQAAKPRAADAPEPTKVTFSEFAEEWTSGRLAKRWPDQVKTKKTSGHDESRLEVLAKVLGPMPLEAITLEDCERAMKQVPATVRTPAARRHYAQALHKLLALAVYPAKLIDRHPLPKGFLPSAKSSKAKSFIYPTEDAQLMAAQGIPLERRVLWGVLAREGMRASECTSLRWRDLDLERGVVTLDENKTDDPRAWALSPGVARALQAWRKLTTPEGEDEDGRANELVFSGYGHWTSVHVGSPAASAPTWRPPR